MPNIDTSTITGFDTMTAEQKVEALLNFEVPESVDLSGYVEKSIFDRKASEAASLSKQLKAKSEEAKALMTEEQQKQAALAEAAEADKAEKEELKARIAELEKNNTLREYTMSFTSLGFDEKLASETAKFMSDGETVKVFDNFKKFLEGYKSAIEAEHLRKMSQPNGAGADSAKGKDAAIEMAKKLAGTRTGTNKSYEDVMSNYLKR